MSYKNKFNPHCWCCAATSQCKERRRGCWWTGNQILMMTIKTNHLSFCLFVYIICSPSLKSLKNLMFGLNLSHSRFSSSNYMQTATERVNTFCSQTHSRQYFIHLQHWLEMEKTSAAGSCCFSIRLLDFPPCAQQWSPNQLLSHLWDCWYHQQQSRISLLVRITSRQLSARPEGKPHRQQTHIQNVYVQWTNKDTIVCRS